MTGGLPSQGKPHTRPMALALALVLSVLVSAYTVPVGAESEVPVVGDLLEAESYLHADAACDPDHDGEHTEVHPDPASSGGAHVFLPHSGCGLDLGTVRFDSERAFVDFVVQVGGSDDTYHGIVRILVDAEVVAEGEYVAHPTDGFRPYPFALHSAPVPAGDHHLRIEFVTLDGPTYGNLFVDVAHTQPASGGGGGGGGGAPALPDLVIEVDRITARSWDPADLQSVFRLQNIGDGFADGTAIDVWYDDQYAGRIDDVHPLAPGWTTWYAFPWPFTEGAHAIRAVIDPDGLQNETAEANNVAERLVPADTPEAYINLVYEPEPLDAHGWTRVRFSVFSTGTAPMPASQVAVRLDGVVVGTTEVPPMDVGTAVALEVAFNAAPGDYRMSLEVDPDDAVVELDERNEWVMWVTLAPSPVPDLAVELHVPDLDGKRYGDRIAVEATVSNLGDAEATGSEATWAIDGETIDRVDLPTLAPGASHTLRTELRLGPGLDHMELRLTPVQGETNEANNAATAHLDLGVPDLEATRLDLDNETPDEGRPTEITAAFVYDGSLGLKQAHAALYDGERLLATWDLHDLQPGSEHTVAYDWTPKGGEHSLRFVVETNGVAEPDREDNVLERDVTVRPATPYACRDLGSVSGSEGLQESCRRLLLGEDDPLGPL